MVIDLDNCIDQNGVPFEETLKIINMFSQCYTEYSPNKQGLHIFCKGK